MRRSMQAHTHHRARLPLQERLPEERFEMMLWRLEVTNAAATDHALAFAGAAPAERTSVAACATTDHLPREDALAMLEETCSSEWLGRRREPRTEGVGAWEGAWAVIREHAAGLAGTRALVCIDWPPEVVLLMRGAAGCHF